MSDVICTNPDLQSPLNRASKDRFILVLNLPPALRKLALTDNCFDIDLLQISVYGTVIPQITVPAVEVRYGGQSTNFTSYSRPNYPPLTVNFVVDNEFRNYYILWKWLALMNDPRLSKYDGNSSKLQKNRDLQFELGMLNEYQTNLSILTLNELNKTTTEFTYYNAFITNLGGINYSYRDGELIETTAEFQYGQLDVSRPKN
tara:strand:+ start:20 stop:625 length:606 start_codon:yes stop_codon:yes gene_type:complete